MSENEILEGEIIDEPEMDPAAQEIANEIGPQIIGQHQLVGQTIVHMSSSGGVHTMTFGNGIKAIFSGTIKLENLDQAEVEGKKQLTGESIHEHFKALEQ
jgi:hypothetical protein